MIWIWVSWIFTLCRLFGWRARPQKSSTWSSKPNRGSKVSWWEVPVLGCLSGLRFFRFLSGNSYGKPWYTLQKPHPILCNVNQSSINPEHFFFFWHVCISGCIKLTRLSRSKASGTQEPTSLAYLTASVLDSDLRTQSNWGCFYVPDPDNAPSRMFTKDPEIGAGRSADLKCC